MNLKEMSSPGPSHGEGPSQVHLAQGLLECILHYDQNIAKYRQDAGVLIL